MRIAVIIYRIIKSLIKNPISSIKIFIQDFKKDINAKNVSSEKYFVWCAGLPKSGSTLIENIFDILPYVRVTGSFLRFYDAGNLIEVHGISERMFSAVPKKKYSFLKTHTHYTENYERIALEKNANIIISFRDIRDMMISRYFHIINDKKHWNHNEIKDLSFEDGFIQTLKSIDPEGSIPIKYYYNWIVDWKEICRKKSYLALWYEDYIKNSNNYIKSILNYVGFQNFPTIDIENELKSLRMEQKNLSSGLKNHERYKSTFRSGKIRVWNEYFTPRISNFFKQNLPGPLDEATYKE